MSCMNRKVVFLVISICILTFAVLPAAFSDVEENFEPAGMVLGGSVSFTYDFGYPFADYGTNTTMMELSIRPVFGIFLIKNLALQISPSYYFYRLKSDENITYLNSYIALGTGVMYYLSRMEPIVPSFGLDMNFSFYPEDDYSPSYFNLGLSPQIYVYFFATDNVAPYAGVISRFFLYNLGHFEGSDSIGVRTSAVLGISVFISGVASPVD
jgi:hypothetical protein